MKPSFEKVATAGSSVVVFERNDSSFPFHWHYHPEFELTLIVDSHGQRLVGDSIEEYSAGDLVLLGPNLPHSWRSFSNKSKSGGHRAVVAQFRKECFGEKLFKTPELHEVNRLLDQAARGIAFGDTAARRKVASDFAKLPDMPPAKQFVALLSALVELAGERQYRTLSSKAPQAASRPSSSRCIDRLCEYLEMHYCQQIDFAALSARFNINHASLCRLFKRMTGKTMTEYINELRVAAATQLLIDTDEALMNICFQVGYGNYSHFSRQFKRLKGRTPRMLRKEFSCFVASRSGGRA